MSMEDAKQIHKGYILMKCENKMQRSALSTRTFLGQELNDRIIGNKGVARTVTRPADYYVWLQLKYRVYQGQQPCKSKHSLDIILYVDFI